MFKFKRVIAFAMLCAGMSSAYASSHQPLPRCVDLAANRQVARFGSQYLLVKDGDAHYRIGFNGSCSAISLSSQVQLRTGDQDNRLCPSGTRVMTRHDSCMAQGVVVIDQDEYASYVRRGR